MTFAISDADEFERRLRRRRVVLRVLGGVGLGAIALVVGGWCRDSMRTPAPGAPIEVPREVMRRAQGMQARYDRLSGAVTGIPRGFREAIRVVDPQTLAAAPHCVTEPPMGAVTFRPSELATEDERDPRGLEVIVVGARIAPHENPGAGQFFGGSVDGVAYLWDGAAGRLICAGHVHAESSQDVMANVGPGPLSVADPQLEADLDDNLDRAVETSLHQAP